MIATSLPYLKYIIGCALIVALFLLTGLLTRTHWWSRVSNAQVIYGGERLPNADVYRSPNGEFLVNLKDLPNERELFVIYPEENKAGLPNERHFIFLPGYAYSRYVSPPVVFMNSAKAETDPMVAVTPRSIQFSTLQGQRVQIIIK